MEFVKSRGNLIPHPLCKVAQLCNGNTEYSECSQQCRVWNRDPILWSSADSKCVCQGNQQQLACHWYALLVHPPYIHMLNSKMKAILLTVIQTSFTSLLVPFQPINILSLFSLVWMKRELKAFTAYYQIMFSALLKFWFFFTFTMKNPPVGILQ